VKPAKSFGILVEGYGEGWVIVVNRQVVNVKIWDISGMGCVKCFGMLVEGSRGRPKQIG
jgi:hypothetical protein